MTENIQNKIYRGIFSGVLVGALSLGTGYLIGQYKNTKIENQTQEYKVSQKENYSLDLENKPQVLEDKLLDR